MMGFNEIMIHAQTKYEDLLREAEAERAVRSERPAMRLTVFGLLSYLITLGR